MKPSISGSFFAKDVLKTIQNTTTAMMRSVPCHCCGSYEASWRVIKPWIIVPATKERPTTAPCHPIARSHPVEASVACHKSLSEGIGTREVTQIFLAESRGKFRHPMVLSTSRGRPARVRQIEDLKTSSFSHRSHFRNAEVDEDAGNDRDGEAPEKAACSSVGESEEEISECRASAVPPDGCIWGQTLTRR